MDNQPPASELYSMTKRALALAEDTNRIVHKMQRAQRWHTIFTIVWWLTVVGITGAVYYYLLAPYLGDIMAVYSKAVGLIQAFKPQ